MSHSRIRVTPRREATKFNNKVKRLVLAVGGTVISDYTYAEPGRRGTMCGPNMRIQTLCGGLRISPYSDWIACQFDAPRAARTLLESLHIPMPMLNVHSGKWNFHYFGDRKLSGAISLEHFETSLRKIISVPVTFIT